MSLKHDTFTDAGTASGQKETSNGVLQRNRLVIFTVVALIIIGTVAGFISRIRHKSELAAETQKLAVPVVSVVSPTPGKSTGSLPLTAEVKPWAEASIYARVSGYLMKRHVDIGSQVKEGQLLAEINTPELDQELARAKSLLVQAETAAGLARISFERTARLVPKSAVSIQENDDRRADFKLKTAAVDSARAEVHRLEKLLSFNRLTAPFAGTITIRNIDSGDLIESAGGKELFHLAQTGKLRVSVQAPQSIAQSIRPGQKAEMTIPEIAGKTFPATVVRTAGALKADSRTLLVELEVENHKNEILAGCYAQVRFTGLHTGVVPTLPGNTVLFRKEGMQVGVVRDDGKVELRSVKLERDFGQRIEILEGVGLNDRVIINPPESLRNGDVVLQNASDDAKKGT